MMSNLKRLFEAAGSAPDEGHAECRALLPSFIEAEMNEKDAVSLYPTVRAHLDICEICDAEYAALLDVALAEERGGLPHPTSYPKVKLPLEVRWQQITRHITHTTLNALNPQWLSEIDVVAQTFFERVRESTGRLTYEPSSLPLGLGSSDSPTLPTLMAAHYALETLKTKYTASDIQVLIQRDQLADALRQLAHEEAVHLGLPSGATKVFEENFVKEVRENAKSLWSLT